MAFRLMAVARSGVLIISFCIEPVSGLISAPAAEMTLGCPSIPKPSSAVTAKCLRSVSRAASAANVHASVSVTFPPHAERTASSGESAAGGESGSRRGRTVSAGRSLSSDSSIFSRDSNSSAKNSPVERSSMATESPETVAT